MVGLLVFNHLSGFCLTFGLFLFLQISILALVEQNIQAWAKFEEAIWKFLACWNSKLAARYHYYSHWHAANWLGPIWDDLYRTWFLKTSQLMQPRFIFIEALNDLTRISAVLKNLKSIKRSIELRTIGPNGPKYGAGSRPSPLLVILETTYRCMLIQECSLLRW